MLLKVQKIYILFSWAIFLFPMHLYAQDISPEAKKDSIILGKGNLISHKDTIVKGNDTLIIRKEVWVRDRESLIVLIDSLKSGGQVMVMARDTIMHVQDTIVIKVDSLISRNDRVLQSIKEFTEKDNFFAKLLKNVLVFDKQAPVPVSKDTYNPTVYSDKKYEPYEGKIIRSVNIKVLDVFGPTINYPDKRPRGFVEKGGNVIHLKSQRWLIKNRLLFIRGDTINSFKVAESERLLRNNNFIYDARITVNDTSSQDSVDVTVIVQDVWSIGFGVGADPGNRRADFSIKDVNFIGLGQTLESKIHFDPLITSGYNYSGAYTVQNIYKTFFTGRIFYSYAFGQTQYGGGVNREFISPAIKWAGGTNFVSYQYIHELRTPKDSVVLSQPAHFVQGDAWIGYGLNIAGNNKAYKGSRLIFSGRIVRSKYYQRPILPDSISRNYSDSYFYLGSIGAIRRRYYKDTYIFGFGRTEDIPEGDLIAFTAGVEDRTVEQRPYLGFNTGFSRYTPFGYLYSRVAAGSFYQNQRWKEGIFLTQFLYFSPLIKLSGWKWRVYSGFRYTQGIHPAYGNYLYLNQEQGLRGFKSQTLRGTSKTVINLETNVFPPLNLVGFRIALLVFADLAWIGTGGKEKLIDKNNFFPAYGIGIRFRNEHLIFNAIQIMLAYYPNNSIFGGKEINLYERGRFYYNFYDFQFSRPGQLPFM